MAGIAGIIGEKTDGLQNIVNDMAQKISHRGTEHHKIINSDGTCLEAFWNAIESLPVPVPLHKSAVWDGVGTPIPDVNNLASHKTPFAVAAFTADGLLLARDLLGIKPLYYGLCPYGLAFASEVKSLLQVTGDIHEFPPGSMSINGGIPQKFTGLIPDPTINQETGRQVTGLRLRLEQAVIRQIHSEEMGSWLSGGLDSSAIAALARPFVRKLHSFVSGVDGAEDLQYGKQMAEFLGSVHHELVVTIDDMLAALPDVIFHLESFDALLVRSSVTNFLTAKMASDYVGSVFSGEGGDELFAGYDYIKDIPPEHITAELEDIIMRLHNTALQRVDRCSQAFGITAFVPFLDLDVLEYALAIPAGNKLFRGTNPPIEKWILRKAVEDILPQSVLWRPKSKFWQGAGVVDLMEQYAKNTISDTDFSRERNLPNGWKLNNKEELMYYRIFREHFGALEYLDWMGRTKGVTPE